MSGKRQKHQLELAFMASAKGETRSVKLEGTEPYMAESETERTIEVERLMEEICEPKNLKEALRRVKRNRGAAGIDGMTVEELPGHLIRHWARIRGDLLVGNWRSEPVRRVEIEKPEGGTRKLGIPTVIDRFVQQAMLQVLQKRWEPIFSDHSHGFRPQRSAHTAIAEAQQHLMEGYGWVVDLDLEKFFDHVHHDRLMARVAERVKDKRVLRVLRGFLQSGVMEGGLVSPTDEGTPQGGPLSPLLSNIVLDELDKELERRGHRFVRYADDCNIYVRSERSGQRVMKSIRHFLEVRLRLRVNEAKSAVDRPQARKILGFTFTTDRRRTIAKRSLVRMKRRVRELTRRCRRVHLRTIINDLNEYLVGWRGYFGYVETPSVFRTLDAWIRHRIRALLWHGWKTPKRRRKALLSFGIAADLARHVGGSSLGVWRISGMALLGRAMPPAYFDLLGLARLEARPT